MATLTRIKVNVRSAAAQQDLNDANKMHQRVMTFLPDCADTDSLRAQTSTLHRLDRLADGSLHLLVRSDFDDLRLGSLPEGYATEPPQVIRLEALHDRLGIGATVRYAITVNPSRSLPAEAFVRRELRAPGQKAPRGKRVAITGPAAISAWWAAKATEAGLQVLGDARINPAPQPGSSKEGQKHRLPASRIEGFATITDVDALISAMSTGIGRGRPFGLGMLTVVPV